MVVFDSTMQWQKEECVRLHTKSLPGSTGVTHESNLPARKEARRDSVELEGFTALNIDGEPSLPSTLAKNFPAPVDALSTGWPPASSDGPPRRLKALARS